MLAVGRCSGGDRLVTFPSLVMSVAGRFIAVMWWMRGWRSKRHSDKNRTLELTVLLTAAELPPAASVTFSSKRDLMSVDRAIFILVNHLQLPVEKECNEQHRQSGIE